MWRASFVGFWVVIVSKNTVRFVFVLVTDCCSFFFLSSFLLKLAVLLSFYFASVVKKNICFVFFVR